jgi:hypothetical protein
MEVLPSPRRECGAVGGDRKGASPGRGPTRRDREKARGFGAGASTRLLSVRQSARGGGVQERTDVMMVSCLGRRGRGGGVQTSR